jgi:CelD/BcsL family acetyltransferase involved in cellulose biosynthesis
MQSVRVSASQPTVTPVHSNALSEWLQVARSTDELAALEADWTELYRRSANRNPFLSYEWTCACWAADGTNAELFVVALREGHRLVALAPLCIERRFGLRTIRFIADDRSDYLGFLCAADDMAPEQALLEQVMGLGGWDLLLLRRLADTSTHLHGAKLPQTFQVHCVRWTSAPYLRSDGDWDQLHRLGPSWFREMRKRSRRFIRDGHKAEFFVGDDAVGWLDSVAEIEAQSWKGRQGTARLQKGGGNDLLRRAFETLGKRGEMELGLAFVGGRPVAFQIDFVQPNRRWHYQCAYDESFGETRAGSVLAYAALERAWERGVREFDYLSGEEPYKLQRTNRSRAIYQVAAHRRTLKGAVAYGVMVAPRSTLRNVPALRAVYESAKAIKRSTRKVLFQGA